MICYRCDEDKIENAFGLVGRPPVGVRRSRVCDVCLGLEDMGYGLLLPKSEVDRYRVRLRAKNLGLDPDEVELAAAEHRGLCDICGKPNSSGKQLALDHDHVTGAFRGFLCGLCNTMLGMAKDDPDVLVAGAAYLLCTGR
jgi:Recombination endonuclease VII